MCQHVVDIKPVSSSSLGPVEGQSVPHSAVSKGFYSSGFNGSTPTDHPAQRHRWVVGLNPASQPAGVRRFELMTHLQMKNGVDV